MKKEDYEKLKLIHIFLLESERNNETEYYNYLNGSPPVLFPMWNHTRTSKKFNFFIDESKKYFPLMVLLKRFREGKYWQYHIDNNLNRKIADYIELIKKIYTFHNHPARYNY